MPGKLCLMLSVLIHGLAGWCCCSTSARTTETVTEAVTVLAPSTITTAEPAEVASIREAPASPPVPPELLVGETVEQPARPVEYASATQSEPTVKDDATTEPPSESVGEVASTAPSPPETPDGSLPVGTEFSTEGLRSPTYRVEGLTPEVVERLIQSGNACVCVFDETNAFVAVGSPRTVPRLDPLATSPWRSKLSERMLHLPGSLAEAVRTHLRADYAYATSPRVRLGVSTSLDAEILRQQQRAVREAGLAWEASAETVGHFVWSGSRVSFRVTDVRGR